MKRAIPPPTKAESDRWDLLHKLGCIVCRLRWKTRPFVPAEIQHINDCGRNISHWHTIPLCVWHHRGVCNVGTPTRDMVRVYGHSWEDGSKLFESDHGSQERLWELTQRYLKLDRSWPESKIFRRTA